MAHLGEIIDGKYTAIIDSKSIPILPGARNAAEEFVLTKGAQRNRKFMEEKVEFQIDDFPLEEILFDPQTSGGLLVTLPEEDGKKAIEELKSSGINASIVGKIHKKFDKDIIIVEGLHGLNEELTMAIEKKNKYKIYISPLTQLNIDLHNRINTGDTRKLRRIVRDNKYRGYNAGDTLRMWNQIRHGEEKYVFRYQDEADVIINSALVYELGVLKTFAEPLLFSVDENDDVYPEALRLINFLRNFLPMPSDSVPKDSILREFIGGSNFFD